MNADSFVKFLGMTNQKLRLGDALLSVMPKKAGRLLDIGAGEGTLTQHYIDRFEHAWLVEPEPSFARELADKFPEHQIVQRRIEGLVGLEERFDWIVASHVLGYMDDPMATLDWMCSRLEPDGKVALIVHDSTNEFCAFLERFYPRVQTEREKAKGVIFEELVQHLESSARRFDIIHVPSMLLAPSLEAFLDILVFIFDVDELPNGPVLEEIREYVSERHLRRNGVHLTQDNHLVVVHA